MDLGLAGKSAVVTGGSSGIGLAITRLLLEEGASVATCARDPKGLADAENGLKSEYGDRLWTMPCDVLDPDQVKRFTESVLNRFGSVDILVNNAGKGRVSTFETTTDEEWREEIEMKFFGVIHFTRELLPALRRSRAPRIVNINALLARQPESHMVATSAARSGVLNLAKSMAMEFATDGVLVNSIILGLIESNQWRQRYEEQAEQTDSEREWLDRVACEKGVPLGRFGKPIEVASAVAFFCSEQASYITGATLEISGGVGRFV